MSHTSKDIVGTLGNELEGKTIIHCITSSISCFLAPQISRKLMRYGAKVIPVLSPEAAKFINPLIFEWATGEIPITKIEGQVEHVKYAGISANKADLILIAPITANSVSKLANGIMDTTVTLVAGTALGNKIPTIIVPTMHEVMMYNPAIKDNLEKLEKMGVEILYPRIEEEKAKIPETDEIVEYCLRALSSSSLKNKTVLVTAGPTLAFIDGIRFISNPSSGKMGFAIANEAWRRGAKVKLVYGNTSSQPPEYLDETVFTKTGDEMLVEVKNSLNKQHYDLVILAAAMNDFKPKEVRDEKISSKESLKIEFEPIDKLADIIKEISPNSTLVLFKAEYKKGDDELCETALKRMKQAKADYIVANDVSTEKYGFQSDDNRVVVIDSNNESLWIEGSKKLVAKELLKIIKLEK